MFAKSNLSKMLRRLAPQQGDGAATTPSDMIMRLRQMMGGQPRSAEVDPGINIPSPPMAYPGGSSNFNESTGLYTPDGQGLSGFMSRFGKLLNRGPGRSVGYREFDEGVGGGVMPQPQVMQPIRSAPEQRPSTVYYDPSGPVAPPRPAGGLTLSMPQDPGFNINTATNTFFKTLGDRVASGQMTLDQARAAQAEMRALQLNPAMANRAAATEIAQRNLQVGPYAPRPQGLTLSNVPQQGSPNALTIARGPVPLNQQGPGLGGSIGAFLGMPGQVSQGAGMPPGMGVLRERIGNMLNPPRRSGFVDTMPLINPDPNFRVGQTPQQMAPNAQGMAMGGLMAKYYGGAC